MRTEVSIGSVVVRATRLGLLPWPGTLALYVLAHRGVLWLEAKLPLERIDGSFLLFAAALIGAERGWLYHAYRRTGATPLEHRDY